MFDKIFRLNPLYSITPFEDLTDEQKKRFQHLVSNKALYGFVHAPREAKLTVKAVNRDLADFLRQFSRPIRLRDAFQKFDRGTKEERRKYIIRLVLDSVLQVLADGEFISGVEAVNRVLTSSKNLAYSGDKRAYIQTISERGIHLAFNSALTTPQDLATYLYNLNCIPINRRWKRHLPDSKALAAYLHLRDDGTWQGMPNSIRSRQIRLDEKGEPDTFDLYWRSWDFKKRKHPKDKPSYKVYFSPLPQDLPRVFQIVRGAVAESGAHFMKIGRHLAGILRPDKLLVYFSEYKQAFDFASLMSEQLISLDPQGVPFSFQVNPKNPIVSMGVDPPHKIGESYSWRLYITTKLALAIQGARRDGTKNPLEYIHAYMQLIGVDSLRWRPLSDDWSIEFTPSGQRDERSA